MAKEEKSFESILKELDEIVVKLESGKVELEDSISLYENGSKLISLSEEKLKQSKLKLEKIKDSAGKTEVIIED